VVHLTKEGEATKTVDVYNIHRNIVGFGSRRSNWMCKQFIRQIDDKNYAAGSNITKFSLPSLQAEVFPMVLDFMYYTNEVKQKLTAEKACCVFLIAEMMDIPPLQEALDAFYRKSLSWKNITEFLMAATSFKAERLLWSSNVKLGSLVMENPELAGLVRPNFLIDLLKINKEQVRELQTKSPELYPDKLKRSQSRIWSRAAYACAMHNTKLMNKGWFDTMTDEACLPEIDPKVALQFLIMDSGYNPETTEYRSLQTRCVTSITENWEEFSSGFSSKDELKREILKLPSRLLNDILLSESTKVEF
jgi:BTB/POZ domain